ncbi:MAG TPA: hypothetical protein VFD27_10125 [Chthoniobacteraceae bacterium]|nr:hypothetical protein [Chthoniobacteraceae bacterium]
MFLFLSPICAQDNEPPPPPKRSGVRITFLPPPLEGTLSLGVYNKAGKLVRTLHREAQTDDFTIGLNGLITFWDGKDDAGAVAPAGKYFARGYAVGKVEIEGEAFHCNEWISEGDEPHIKRMEGGGFSGFAGVQLNVELVDGRFAFVQFLPDYPDRAPVRVVLRDSPVAESPTERAEVIREMGLPGDLSWFEGDDAAFAFGDGKLWRRIAPKQWEPVSWQGLGKVATACWGQGQNSVWVVDETDGASDVKEYSLSGEVLRHLAIPKNDPAPRSIDVKGEDELFLLEEGSGVQRVRLLWKEAVKSESKDSPPVSTWKTRASRSIWASDTFATVADKLGREKPFVPEEKIRVRILPNQLFKNASQNVDVQIAVDAKGSFLRTIDGLPLLRVTESPFLKWAVMGREEGKALTIFQSDGAVVEEFKARRLANMMAFDAGDYEWAGK